MTALNEIQAWGERYRKGVQYWQNQIPGLALIHELLINNAAALPPQFQEKKADFDFALGLGLLAIHRPHYWGPSHLTVADNFKLMGNAVARLDGPDDDFAKMFTLVGKSMNQLQPQEPLEKRLENVTTAYTVVGQRGSGKGTILKFMEEKGVSTAASSRGLRAVTQVLLQRDATTPELVEMGKEFKNMFGFDVFIKMVLSQITSLPPEMWQRIGIDGLRTQQEIDIFRQLFKEKSKIIGIVSSRTQTDEEGWKVVQARQQTTGRVEYVSFADYVSTQQDERARIEKLIDQADIVITNDGTEQELREKVYALLT